MKIVASALLAAASLAGCANLTALSESNLVVLPAPATAWRISFAHANQQAELSGQNAVLARRNDAGAVQSQMAVSASSGPDGRREALQLSWQDTWYAPLHIDAPQALDLRPWLGGTLELDLQVTDLAQGGLLLKVGCGEGCERRLWLVEQARAQSGRGRQHLAFNMSCFVRDGADFSKVRQPFTFELIGKGQVELAKLHLTAHGQANASCPDYRTESVTPAQQVDTWTQYWWPQRHEAKLEEARKLKAAGTPPELVFIGDSITQHWEDEGRAVWQQHYAKFHALNLGFSGDHTENVLWRLRHGEVDGIGPKVAVLMIGTNNTGNRQEAPETTAAGVRAILDELRARLPTTQVLLLAVFPRDEQPNTVMRKLNQHLSSLIAREADGRRVHFLSINAALTNPDGTLSQEVAPDRLHLSAKGYAIWQREMDPQLQTLLAH